MIELAMSYEGSVGDPPEFTAQPADPPGEPLRRAVRRTAEGGEASSPCKSLVPIVAYGAFDTAAGRCENARPAVEVWPREPRRDGGGP